MDYVEEGQTKVFEETGAFFAFNDKQMKEKTVEDVVYVNMGGGLICPKANASTLVDKIHENRKEGIQKDLKDHTVEDIIWREFANYECQIRGDFTDAQEALEGYGIEAQKFREEWLKYYQHCVDKDYF